MLFLYCDESKSELARNLDDCIQSQNVSCGTSDDLYTKHLRGRGHMGIINGVYASAEIFSALRVGYIKTITALSP